MKLLELFGGIGAPRLALQNIGVDVKSIDYVEIDEAAVRSYNAMFPSVYIPQDVCGWNMKPDILVHGSPCQDFSIAGHQKGADEGSETRSSLMWETLKIIRAMGEWQPEVVIWENVKNVRSKYMIKNHERYLSEMQKMGYTNSYAVLNAMDYGIPQKRERLFTVSRKGKRFDFNSLEKKKAKPLHQYLESDVPDIYAVTQPSVLSCIGHKGIRRATVIHDFAYTITTRQDRTPAQIIDTGKGYRYLTERECWRLMGYGDKQFEEALAVSAKRGRYYMDLYKQAGNSICVPVLEAMFKEL